MISPEEIHRRISEALPGSTVDVQDMTGGGDHYEISIVAEQFENMEGQLSAFDSGNGSTIITERNKKAFSVLTKELKAGKNLSFAPRESTRLDFELRYAGELFATNDNQVEIDSYVVSNLRLSQEWQKEQWTIQAFIGVNNLFDELYNSNIRINAFGGRYYEPAQEQNWYAGVSARFGR